MRKMNKSTLDFINKNIKTNAQASSYPLRKLPDIKIASQDVTSPSSTLPSSTLPSSTLTKVSSTNASSPILKTA